MVSTAVNVLRFFCYISVHSGRWVPTIWKQTRLLQCTLHFYNFYNSDYDISHLTLFYVWNLSIVHVWNKINNKRFREKGLCASSSKSEMSTALGPIRKAFFFSHALQPLGDDCRGFTFTFRHSAFGSTPPDDWSARRTDLCLTTLNIHRI
jgi:hypothetical protein